MSEKKKENFLTWLENEIDTAIKESRSYKSERDDKKIIKCLAMMETYLAILQCFRLRV